MSALVITIETDNAAFTEDDNPGAEVWRILSRLGRRLEDERPGGSGSLMDLNGNSVGTWEWTA